MKHVRTNSSRQIFMMGVTVVLLFSLIGSGLILGERNRVNPNASASASYPADINSDGVVNISDVSLLLSKWGTTDTGSDVNRDGTVSISDLSFVLSKWGTSTPATFQANCINAPHLCGYPDETNTGVPAGVTLTNSGSITVRQDGAIVQNLNITGNIVIQANNVTIRNVRITSGDYYPIAYYSGGFTGLLVEDTEIIGTSSDVTAGISFENFTARRVNIHGSADGIKANNNAIIEDSYIHDLAVNLSAGTHNDGLQSTGGSGVTIRHNTMKLGGTGANACLQLGNEAGTGNNDLLITNNLFDGGGWTINSSPVGTNRTVTNNRFTRNAAYGTGGLAGSTWTGNYYDNDGSVVQ